MASQDEGQRAHKLKAEASIGAHAVTGALEGAAGVYATEPFLDKYLHGRPFQSPFKGTPGSHFKKIAIGGAVGALATAPFGAIVETIRNRRARKKKLEQQQMSAKHLSTVTEFAATLEKRLNDIPRAKPERRKVVTAAGVGAAALGLSTLPGASKFFGIQGRMAAGKAGWIKTNEGGRMVADYLEGAQKILNRGIKGKVVGAALQNAIEKPEGFVSKGIARAFGGKKGDFAHVGGRRLAMEHYASFRSSPMRGMKFWDWEQGVSQDRVFATKIGLRTKTGEIPNAPEGKTHWQAYQESRKPQPFRAPAMPRYGKDISASKLAAHERSVTDMHYAREKAHKAIKEQIEVHGKNEMEAIKHVAHSNSDPQVQHYFNTLAAHKRVASTVYARKALLSPALIAGGTGAIVVGRKRNQNPQQAVLSKTPLRNFEALLEELVQFDSDPTPRALRSGVRLDKYQKTIRNREIDRHIHDYLRAGILGAASGVVIPGATRLRNRVLIGAGAGTALQGALHASGRKDDYGEQSEESKILQRSIPKWAATGAIVGGLVSRYRSRKRSFMDALTSKGRTAAAAV